MDKFKQLAQEAHNELVRSAQNAHADHVAALKTGLTVFHERCREIDAQIQAWTLEEAVKAEDLARLKLAEETAAPLVEAQAEAPQENT